MTYYALFTRLPGRWLFDGFTNSEITVDQFIKLSEYMITETTIVDYKVVELREDYGDQENMRRFHTPLN